jgi:uncharacterized protein YjcR
VDKKPDWHKLKAEYIAGGISYRKLAEKYGVSFSTLKEIARREKWTELREKAQHKADTTFANLMGKKQANRTAKIDDVADKLLDKIEFMLGQPAILTTQGIKHLTSAIKDIKEIKGIKSDIDLKEQNARINKLIKDTEEEQKDTNINITFGDEVRKYGV